MTTNVFDSDAGVIATDSRWSFQHGWFLVYVDDTAFEKVEAIDDYAVMFAGKGRVIQTWKTYLRSRPTDGSGMPDCDGMCITGIHVPTKQVRLSEGNSITRSGAIFAGSGSEHAVKCWSSNRDAQKAVETAKVYDVRTGGQTMYFDFQGKHNLAQRQVGFPGTIDEVDQALLTRGNIMDVRTLGVPGVPFKLATGAANDAEQLEELRQKLESGEASAEAPCDAMYSEWTPEAKGRLKEFLGDMFKWK